MKYLLPIILSIVSLQLWAQSERELEIQQIEQQVKETKSDTTKVRLLCLLSNKLRAIDLGESERYSHEALEIAQKTNEKYYIAKSLNSVGQNFIYVGEYNKALVINEKARTILNADTLNLNNNKLHENRLLGQIYNSLGTVFDFKSQYAKSIKYYLKGKDIFEEIENLEGLGVTYNNLGISYMYVGDYKKSHEYFNESYRIYMVMGDTSTAYSAKMNLGIIKYFEGDFEQALMYFKESENEMRKIGNVRSLGHCITNIGEAYKELGQYDSAIVYIKEGIEIDFQLEDKEGLGTDYRILADTYIDMGELNLAEKYVEKALDIAIEIDRKTDLKDCYKKLYIINEKANRYELAFKYHKLYTAYNDTIKSESSSSKLGKIEAENEFNKQMAIKEVENKKLLEIEEEKRARQTTILYFTIAIMVVVLFFVYMVWRSLKNVKKQKELVVEANNQIEEKNKELTDSIRYAKRIQLALLKEDNSQLKNIPEHFILFEPKDIVSGDFYWTYHMEQYWYIAAADCTGHGVPGAMLTMLGTAYLNEICSGNDLHTPAQLLDLLKQKITTELSQTGSQGESKDGMDMSVIRMNLTTGEVEWAGANNPLYQISDGALTEIKADKQPIGYSEKVSPFTNHNISLKKGDSLYLFSDGYADQFGGEKGKKYKYSNFKKVLSQTNSMSPEDQKNALLESFRNWQGNLEQLDDVCVIGIRF